MHLPSIISLKNNRAAHILIMTSAILVLYFGLWNNYFSSEDDFIWAGMMHQLDSFSEAFRGIGNGVRFLWFLRIWILDRLFHLDATPYYWMGLLQHLLVTLMVYWLVETWTGKRALALLAAFFFGTKFSYFEVITSVSAIGYTFWAMFYFLSLVFFNLYLKERQRRYYAASLLAYLLLSGGHDYTLHLPMMLLASHLFLYGGFRALRALRWKEFLIYIPFLLIWAGHVGVQVYYILQGSSEAVSSEVAYQPGLHMITNLFYLVFLLVPNVQMPPIYNFLREMLGPAQIEQIWLLTHILAWLAATGAVYAFYKGSSLIRLSLAMILIPFLQYLMWEGNYAGASRYLYIPSFGFSILLASALLKVHQRLSIARVAAYIAPALVVVIFLLNWVPLQVWVQQQVHNAVLRRAFVNQLAVHYGSIDPGSEIIIEVPELDFTDLVESCGLVYTYEVHCEVFIRGERPEAEILSRAGSAPVYWLEATQQGIIEKYSSAKALQ